MALLGLGLSAAGITLAATRYGPGMTSDTMTYLAASETWLAGLGLGRFSGPHGFKPMTHFPPLFPLLLAGAQLLGVTWIAAARWLSAIFQGGTVLAAGLFLGSITKSAVASLLGVGLLVLSPIFLEVNAQALSEASFLFLGFCGLWLLTTAGDGSSRWRLVLGGISIGLAYLARYVGISLVAAGVGYLLLRSRGEWRSRAKEAAVFLGCSLAGIAIWVVRNVLWTGVATNRRWVWHPPPPSYFGDALRLLWGWIAPIDLGSEMANTLGGLFVAVMLFGAVLWALRRVGRRENASWRSHLSGPLGILILFGASYLAVLLISRTFLDATTPFDDRIASPIYVVLSIAVCATGWQAWEALRKRPLLRVLPPAVAALALVSFGARTAAELQEPTARNRGGLASSWRTGPLREVWDLPAGTVIYTDNIERLYFYYGRGGFQVQQPVDPVTGLPRRDIQAQHAEVRHKVIHGEAVLLLLVPGGVAESVFPDITAGLTPAVSTEHGTLYVGPYGASP